MHTKFVCVTFVSVLPLDSGSVWGPLEWSFDANAQGERFGDDTVRELRPGRAVDLNWTTVVDVGDLKPGDKIVVELKAIEHGVLGTSDRGMVRATLRYPFALLEETDLWASKAGLLPAHHFRATVHFRPGPDLPWDRPPPTISAAWGNEVVIGLSAPRVEIHPVIPIPMTGGQGPKRPKGFDLKPTTRFAWKPKLTPALALNAVPNPSLIPVLSEDTADFSHLAAKLAITYLRPKEFDTRRLYWKVQSGPVKIHGNPRGLSVLAYGTESAADPAILAVRLDGPDGPILCLFRAFVGEVLKLPYRVNIIDYVAPPGDANAQSFKPRSRPADIVNHIKMANVLLYQSGLLLTPDDDRTAYDGAQDGGAAAYTVTVTHSTYTWESSYHGDARVPAMRLNWRPGVLNICYVKSLVGSDAGGAATDRPGLPGGLVELEGTPSSSWRSPSGMAPDGDATTVVMDTMTASDVRSGPDFINHVTARGLDVSALSKMYGFVIGDYRPPEDSWYGRTIAHETGHVLGLCHRGSGASRYPFGSDDQVNDPWKTGFPWHENVMAYGEDRSLDLDLIQTKVLRRHPAVSEPVEWKKRK
jgi:hypothetical protein